MGRGVCSIAALSCMIVACGADAESESDPDPPEPTCGPDDVFLLDGSCVLPGVPADGCGVGFTSDALGGCLAVMPPAACSDGLMAIPGETTCREVAPCAEGTWGDIATDASTQFVDGAFTGTSSGTQQAPWQTIQDAVDAAAPGATVAVAEGSYAENVLILDKAVHLKGRCPALVSIAGTTAQPAVSVVRAPGSSISGVAISGGSDGVGITASRDVVVERVWIHDDGGDGLLVDDTLGEASAIFRDSLIERTAGRHVFTRGAELVVERCAFRGGDADGAGLWIQDDVMTARRSLVDARQSVIEGRRDLGVFIGGSDVHIEDTLIRDIFPRLSDMAVGRGLEIIDDAQTGNASKATLRGVVVERVHQTGVFIAGSEVSIVNSVVRDVFPRPSDQQFGRGITTEPDPQSPATSILTLQRTLVERTTEIAVYIAHGQATLDRVWVRAVQPRPSDQRFGRGIEVHDSPEGPAGASIAASLVSDVFEAGIVIGSPSSIDRMLVRDVRAAPDGLFGDGIATMFIGIGVPTLTLNASRILRSARAGVTSFDGSVALSGNTLECNAIDIAGQQLTELYAVTDLGGNTCGCDGTSNPCQVLTPNLTPPAPAGL